MTHKTARMSGFVLCEICEFTHPIEDIELTILTEFAISVRNVTPQALKVTIPFGHMESHPKLQPHQLAALHEMNRQNVGYDPQADTSPEAKPSPEVDEPQAKPQTPETETRVPPAQTPQSEPTTGHRELQNRIKQAAQKCGFSATVEQRVLGGKGRVDVALERDGLRIACEVSVTTKPDHELHNIEKCLAAGFDQVWVTSPDAARLNKLGESLWPSLSDEMRERVLFLSEDELIAQLEQLTKHTSGSQSTVLGYEVQVVHVKISPRQTRDRRKRLVATLSNTRQQNKRGA